MAVDSFSASIDAAGAYIYRKAQQQSWFQRNSNTVTAVAGFIATLLSVLSTMPFANDPRVALVVGFVGFALTCVGVKRTPNGWSTSQINQLNAAQSYFIDSAPLIPEEFKRELNGDGLK